jgi:NAD(P)H-flavin reductase
VNKSGWISVFKYEKKYMLSRKYKSEIISIENPLKDIYTLRIKSLSRRYKYFPGQFLHLAIDADYDGIGQWPDSRCFSMQSNPDEDSIRITYAVKGSFTKKMADELKEGSEIWLKLPYGDLFQQDHKKEGTVLISGGTGITPFLSLFSHETFKEYVVPKIYLGLRSKDYHIYTKELERFQNTSAIIKTFYEDKDGIIDIDYIFAENGNSVSYFISGPPGMISSFKKFLIDKGVPDANILTDDWE